MHAHPEPPFHHFNASADHMDRATGDDASWLIMGYVHGIMNSGTI